jgi:phosphatidylserine/phosphatidylglycerophosphate/cardiolipin synthase-like enzyme
MRASSPNMPKKLVGFLLVLASLLACAPAPTATPSSGTPTSGLIPITLPAGYGAADGWYEIYFTEPFSNIASSETGGPDGPLVKSIDSARESVDVAAYSLTLGSVRKALIDADRRGVTVRVVMESDNMDSYDVQKLLEAEIPVIGDRREGLMHNKFMVIDRSEVWAGSMNFTDSGTYRDNNNLIHIHSRDLAENYMTEFDEMFTDDLFGPDLRAATPHPDFTVDGTRIESLFSPDDKPAAQVNKLLQSAKESIHFLAFSFTNNEFGDTLIEQSESGVTVSGVMEDEQVRTNQGTEYDKLSQAGLDVRLDGNPDYMHHKVFIIDEQIVVLGSYNFSTSAETRNDENLLVIYSPELAGQFMEEFQRVYGKAASE